MKITKMTVEGLHDFFMSNTYIHAYVYCAHIHTCTYTLPAKSCFVSYSFFPLLPVLLVN